MITLTQGSLKSSTLKTGCPAKTIEKDNECGVCAPGYGLNTDKDKCVICNYGSWSAGGYVSCTPCVNPTLTTQLLGSTNVLSCIPKTDVCVVGGIKSLNGVLVPPQGSRVLKTTSIKSVCPTGFNQEFGVKDNFLCSQKSYPICHEMCNLTKYNRTDLEKRNIMDNFESRMLYHNEKITITCRDDYEYKIGSRPNSQTFVCDDGEIDIGECEKVIGEVLVTIIIVVVIIVLAFMIIVIWVVVKSRRKTRSKSGRGTREIEMGRKSEGNSHVVENRNNNIYNDTAN